VRTAQPEIQLPNPTSANACRGAEGFSLVEILVAVAILAILSATLSPLVIKFINDGRRARALSDAQTIGTAIMNFQVDNGVWPVSDDGVLTDAAEISRLVGTPLAGVAGALVPEGNGGTTGAWKTGGNAGTAAALEDHLIFNRSTVNPLYPVSATPPEPPGWAGPYLKSVPLDPWGRAYVCNVRYLVNAGVVAAAVAGNHAVMCLSAGPNGLWDTPFDDTAALSGPTADDIGYLIQGNQTRP
jgi:prepilin-type N-terminal cleavage/methylation domain-containing protein